MLLKGLVLGGAALAAALVVAATLTLFRPQEGGFVAQPAPAAEVIVLPNGMAAPRLQPAQSAAAPILADDVSLVSLVATARDSAEATLLKLTAEKPTQAVEQKALYGCGGN